jgi:hypothetical protein
MCAVKLHYSTSYICVLSTYRSPSGKFSKYIPAL